MGSPEVSSFSVENLLRPKGPDETRQHAGVRDDILQRPQLGSAHSADVRYAGFYSALHPPVLGGLGAHSHQPACCRPAAAGCCGLSSFFCYPAHFSMTCHGVRSRRFPHCEGPQPQYEYLPQAPEAQRGSRIRSRTVFTEIQIQQLELLFGRTDYPTPDEREELARSTGLSHEVIRVWFKNRRARRKNHNVARSPNANLADEARNELMNNHS